MRHRLLLLVFALLLISIGDTRAEEIRSPIKDIEALRQARREAAHRPRRMIFNNDGDDVIYTKKAPTAEALLALRTTPLVGSQVDAIFYSNSLCFGDALHQSQVFTPFSCTDYIFQDNGLPQLLERGIDPIQVMIDFGRRQGIEVFWDMRMNDTHDAGLDGYGPYLLPKLKRDHPEYLVGTPEKPPRYGTWSSVNYAVPEVRELAYRFFEEVCRKFNVDGIELDFFRHACFFKGVADGGLASREELEMMTELVRRIREMTEREGLRRGRPILVAIRVPDSVEFCRAIGLDLEKWLSEGLSDMLIGTCYFQLNPWEYLVELGHRHDVPVYPSLSESRVQGETRLKRQSIESYRARAMRAWAAGADGIYLFNYFDPRGAVWRELGDPQLLARKNKLYFVTVRDGDPERYLAGGRQCRHVPVLTPASCRVVPADNACELEFLVGDDLAWAEGEGLKPRATCHIQATAANVEVSINGEALKDPKLHDDWLDFPVPVRLLRKGANRLAVRATEPEKAAGEAPEWTVVWDGSQMPAHPWAKMGFVRDCAAEMRGDGLLLADRGDAAGSYAYYQNLSAIRPADEVVVEFRVKTLSGWCSVLIENGVNGEEIMLLADQIKIRHCGLSCPMVTGDAAHTYRVVIHQQDIKVYADGELKLDGTGRLTHPAPNGRSGVAFGGANSPQQGEAVWSFVKIRNPAVTWRDAALSIEYAGN
ncbi:MAG: hypothetical protein GXY83_04000 [Rhodopirellula sp.]|nr:hypothetical protein [Rhodopirellula sp.]